MNTNQYNQPIGEALPNFSVGATPHITLLFRGKLLLVGTSFGSQTFRRFE